MDAKARVTEISVNDMNGFKNIFMTTSYHLLHFLKINAIYLGMYWTYAVYLEMPKTFFVAIKKIFCA